MDNLLSALYSFPGGYLSDRLGHKRALLLFNLIALAGYAIVILIPSWPAVFVGSVFFLSWTAISLPAIMGLVSRVLPQHKRTMGVSLHSLVRRIPMALGPLIGGMLIALYGEKAGVRLAFVGAFTLGLASVLIQQVMIEPDKPIRRSAEKSPLTLWRFMGADLRRLLVSDILIRYAEQIPYAFVVVWCLKNNAITAFQFGILTAIEMTTAMLVYIPVAYLADRSAKKPFVVITFFNFTLFPLFLLFSHSFSMMVLAFIIRGLKEFGEPTRKALIMDLSPEDRKAGMFGLYYLVRDVVVSLSAFGGAFLWQISPAANLLTATGFGVFGTAYFWVFGRDLKTPGAHAEGQGLITADC
jgi:MFS family permease